MQVASPVLGEQAPDATLAAVPGGSKVRLAAMWSAGPLVLVFLRQPGCPFCRQMLAQLRRAARAFLARNATVAVVLPVDVVAAQATVIAHAPPFVCLADPQGAAYDLYGVRQGSLLQVAGPAVVAAGVQAILRGHLPGLPRGDVWRLSAVFVIGSDGRVSYVHRARNAADNPSADRLLAAIDGLAAVRPRPETP